MKETSRLRILLPLLLCALLFSACATPVPEESSVPVEESGESIDSSEVVPAPEDETAKAVRAYLEELLEVSWSSEWLTEERVEAIRESVKQLKAPILTEEDVLRVAKRALALVAIESAERTRFLHLPACGVLAEVVWSSMEDPDAAKAFYTALIAYTLYLFTSPEYVFRESELWGSAPSASSDPILYLPLAGDYTSRRGALTMLQEGKNVVVLPISGFGNGEHPLDSYRCGTGILLDADGEMLTLDLLELAGRENVTLPEEFFIARAEAYVEQWLYRTVNFDRYNFGDLYDILELPDGYIVAVYLPLPAEDVQEVKELREMVELLSAPVLTQKTVKNLERIVSDVAYKHSILLLPGLDGKEDVLLPPDPQSQEDLWTDQAHLTKKANVLLAYLIDLFTPSAYRYTDLFGQPGTFYALDGETECYALITEAYLLGEEDLTILCVEDPIEERTE